MLAVVGIALAGTNVISYHQKFADKMAEAKSAVTAVRSHQTIDDSTNIAERSRLYELLTNLGRDKELHGRTPYGVVILDPDFYRGAYVDKPYDTLLDACAIQPFVVPAITGMPLLSPFAPEQDKCRFESYGYQYLAPRHPMTEDEAEFPCKLASARGFTHIVVIRKENHQFTSERMSCAA
ncbi:hypothetical protein [Cupriavidus pauculus]|uniref:Uncharacterized protein n=1 Tax=Cupriavidus pauculus TaxID=82633 RepID=A0A2N5C437_9BURK|nr:hypothetical protein [Cupriavidus pauculus]PLP96986.1 hypothetical protein CYJ10_29530 [Cupriavidus pauculus]